GDDRGGSLMGLEARTGETRWTLSGDGPGYASPVWLHYLETTPLLIALTDRSIVGATMMTGVSQFRLPYKDEWNENIVTPVFARNGVIFSGVRKPTTAVRIGDDFVPHAMWTNDEISMYMSTPVTDGDYLYGLSAKKKGQFFCLDTRTGK